MGNSTSRLKYKTNISNNGIAIINLYTYSKFSSLFTFNAMFQISFYQSVEDTVFKPLGVK